MIYYLNYRIIFLQQPTMVCFICVFVSAEKSPKTNDWDCRCCKHGSDAYLVHVLNLVRVYSLSFLKFFSVTLIWSLIRYIRFEHWFEVSNFASVKINFQTRFSYILVESKTIYLFLQTNYSLGLLLSQRSIWDLNFDF